LKRLRLDLALKVPFKAAMRAFPFLVLVGLAIAAGFVALAQGSRPPAPAPDRLLTRSSTPPEISRDLDRLPAQVRAMRTAIIEAARSGDLERMRSAIERNEMPPVFARGQRAPTVSEDLLRIVRERSGDGLGRQVMAEIITLFALGYARINIGDRQEMFVWPYLAALDPRLLDAEQEVELYRFARPDQLKEWREKGRYLGPRLGIGPDGTWHYFVTGE
jgi:hypothetical protein